MPHLELLERSGFLFSFRTLPISIESTKTREEWVFPAYLGQNRLEVQLQFANAQEVTKNGADNPASIASAVKMMIHQIEAPISDIQKYSDSRGQYSVITRRYTEITNGWTTYATGGEEFKINQVQPLGTCLQICVIAVPAGTAEVDREVLQTVKCSHISITADSITQRSLDTAAKCEIELWCNGFVGNSYVPNCSRLCFNGHGADDNLYSGGFQMSLNSQISISVKFPVAVDFRVYAVQLQRTTINSLGLVQAGLE